MSRFRKALSKLVVTLGVAAALLVGSASTAEAGFTLTLHETGFLDQTFNLTSGQLNTVGPISFNGYNITVTASDSAPGLDPVFGTALVSQNTFTVNNASATAPLVITVQDDTFNSTPFSPGNPITVRNSVSSTFIGNGTVTANGFVSNGTPTQAATQTLTTANLLMTGPLIGGTDQNSAQGSISPLGTTFTVGNKSTVSLLAGSQANFTVTTHAVPAPAPAGLVLALTGLPVLGMGGWLRRRRQMA